MLIALVRSDLAALPVVPSTGSPVVARSAGAWQVPNAVPEQRQTTGEWPPLWSRPAIAEIRRRRGCQGRSGGHRPAAASGRAAWAPRDAADAACAPRSRRGRRGPRARGKGREETGASARPSVSRVLSRRLAPSRMAIHLGPPVARRLMRPTRGLGSAPLPTVARGYALLFGLAPGGVCLVSLRRRLAPAAASSLWHWSSSRDGRALPATLRCGARTFLTPFNGVAPDVARGHPTASLTSGVYPRGSALPMARSDRVDVRVRCRPARDPWRQRPGARRWRRRRTPRRSPASPSEPSSGT